MARKKQLTHELRTALTAIGWLVDFLKKERLTKQGRAYLADIGVCVDRMNATVDTAAAKPAARRKRLV